MNTTRIALTSDTVLVTEPDKTTAGHDRPEFKRPISISFRYSHHGEVVATFDEAGIAFSGEDPADAVEGLLDEILDAFDDFLEHESRLGLELARQLEVLRKYLHEETDEARRGEDRLQARRGGEAREAHEGARLPGWTGGGPIRNSSWRQLASWTSAAGVVIVGLGDTGLGSLPAFQAGLQNHPDESWEVEGRQLTLGFHPQTPPGRLAAASFSSFFVSPYTPPGRNASVMASSVVLWSLAVED